MVVRANAKDKSCPRSANNAQHEAIMLIPDEGSEFEGRMLILF